MANDNVRRILHDVVDDLCDRAETIDVSNYAFLRQLPPRPGAEFVEREETGAHSLTVHWQEPHG